MNLCRQDDSKSAHEAMKILQENDFDVNARCSETGKTLLMIAAWRGHFDLVKCLLEDHGADPNLYALGAGNLGKTAIQFACTRCRNHIVMLLLSKGSRVTIVNNKGQTLRSLAATHLEKDTRFEIEKIEQKQIKDGWLDFSDQGDGNTYGDLDPRFEAGRKAMKASSSSSSSSSIDVVKGTTKESRRERYESYKQKSKNQDSTFSPLSRFVGPYLSENLEERAITASNKLKISSSPIVNSWIKDKMKANDVRSQYILRGYLFYPLREFKTSSPCKKLLNKNHLRGWLVNSVEELIKNSSTILEASEQTRWVILNKLYWLAPVRAESNTDFEKKGEEKELGHEEDQENEAVTMKVPIHRLECLCMYDVEHKAHQRRECRSIANINDRELLKSNDLMRKFQMMDGLKSILVAQLEIVERDMKRTIWEEKSRGFVLYPKNWHDTARILSKRKVKFSPLPSAYVYEAGTEFIVKEVKTEEENKNTYDIKSLISAVSSSENLVEVARRLVKQPNAGDLILDFILRHIQLRSDLCHVLLSSLMKTGKKKNVMASESKKKMFTNFIRQALVSHNCHFSTWRVIYRVLKYLKLDLDLSEVSTDDLRATLQASISDYRILRDFVDVLVLINRKELMTPILAEEILKESHTSSKERRLRLEIVQKLCTTTHLRKHVLEKVFAKEPKNNKKELEKIVVKNDEEKTSSRIIMSVSSERELKDVIFVDDANSLTRSMDDVCHAITSNNTSNDVIAMDCEWDPKRKHLQLIQISTFEKVYVFDVQRIVQINESKRFTGFLSNHVFEKCVILGWSIAHDLKQICVRFPDVKELRCVKRCVDLQRHVVDVSGKIVSLSAACFSILGIGLNKSEQISTWSSRPLSNSQKEYAALDAWALIRLAKKIEFQSFVWSCPFPMPLGVNDVREDLRQLFDDDKVADSIRIVKTIEDLAHDEILVKTIAFIVRVKKDVRRSFPICVCVSIDDMVDMESLKSFLKERLKKKDINVNLASVSDLITIFGFVPGALGPCGLRNKMMTVLDKKLCDQVGCDFDDDHDEEKKKKKRFLCCGAGMPGYNFSVCVFDFVRCMRKKRELVLEYISL